MVPDIAPMPPGFADLLPALDPSQDGPRPLRGIPEPTVLPGLPEAEEVFEASLGVHIVCPGFQPDQRTLRIQVPCEVRDVEWILSKDLAIFAQDQKPIVVAAEPQPRSQAAVFLLYPPWTSSAGLSAVVFDLSAMQPGGRGPITAGFLSRPTNVAEIRRETGIYSMPDSCRIYVGSSTVPLGPETSVAIDSGCVVTLRREADGPPTQSAPFCERLRLRPGGEEEIQLPFIPAARAVTLLHTSGRFLFSGARAPHVTPDQAAADFVGVPRHTVQFCAPAPGFLERLAFRGSNLTGLIALVDLEPDGRPPIMVFIDLRQVAGATQFAKLDDCRITNEQLRSVLPFSPPPGWKLKVQGGRRREGYIKVHSADTLVFSFGWAADSDSDFEVFSDSSSDRDNDDEGEEEDEDEDGHDSDCPSQVQAQDASGVTYHRWIICADIQADNVTCDRGLEQIAGTFPLQHFVVHGGDPKGIRQAKVTDASQGDPLPASAAGLTGRLELELQRTGRGPDINDNTPVFTAEAPGLFMPQQPTPAFIRALFLVFAPEVAPEPIVLPLPVDITVEDALQRVGQARMPDLARRFHNLLPASPQPSMRFATLVALPSWCTATHVVFDCVRVNDTLFVACVLGEVDRVRLLTLADLDPTAPIEVYVPDRPRPLQPGERVLLFSGQCIHFVPSTHPAFAVAELSDMRWDADAFIPGALGTWFYVITDAEPFFLGRAPGAGPMRSAIATTLNCSEEAIHIQPAVPRVLDAFDFGMLCQNVIVASQAFCPDTEVGATETVFIYDLRPILCGWFWSVARDHRVHVPTLVSRFESACPEGHFVSISGGLPSQDADGLYLEVHPGCVLVVDFVAGPITSSACGSDSSDSDLDSSGAGGSDSNFDEDAAPSAGPTFAPPVVRSADPRPQGHDAGSAHGRAHITRTLRLLPSLFPLGLGLFPFEMACVPLVLEMLPIPLGPTGTPLPSRLPFKASTNPLPRQDAASRPDFRGFYESSTLIEVLLEHFGNPQHPLVAWTWMLASNAHDLPALFAMESEAFRLQLFPQQPSTFRRYGQQEVQIESGHVKVEITAVSYNALTLKDKCRKGQSEAEPVGLRVTGRRAVLIRELDKHAPLLVGLQETRLQQSAILPDSHYVMLQAGATEQGVGGCALWIAKHRPYGFYQGKPLFLKETHATVTGYSRRHINVCLEAPFLRLFVSVQHGPSLANHTAQEVTAFWRDRQGEVQRRPQGMDYILLVDSNARLGDLVSVAVGPHQAEQETFAGTLFHDFALALEGFLPATFQDFQTGPGDTWSTVQGSLHRIDYIVLPQAWRSFDIQTRTLQGFEALQLREDHTPVAAHRPQPATAPAHRQRQLEVLSSLQPAPWWADVDTQFDWFVQSWTAAGSLLDEGSDSELCSLIHKLGLPSSAITELAQQLRTLSILPDFGANAHLASIVQDMLSATWFTIGINDVITLTRKGSRPGDPAADVIFSLVFAAFVKTVDGRLQTEGLAPSLAAWGPNHSWADADAPLSLGLPSWADDFVSPVTGRNPSQLLDHSQRTAQIIQEMATSIGMRLTYAPDKTAALLPCGVDWQLHGATVDPELGMGFSVQDRLAGESHHVEADVDLVLQYLPGLSPLFLDAMREDPSWWLGQVKKACKIFQSDMDAWHRRGSPSVAVPTGEDLQAEGATKPYQCPLCPACFPLRKHVGAHMAKAHKTWSPTRHFTLDVYCHGCHVWYGTAAQVNFHLKRYPACLRRVCQLFPPLTTPQIRAVEFEEQRNARKVRQGQWARFRGVRQRALFFGPKTPTASERLAGVDFFDEDPHVVGSPDADYKISGVVLGKVSESAVDSMAEFGTVSAPHFKKKGEASRRGALKAWLKLKGSTTEPPMMGM
ncbi:unnamed protein product, partial [Symbiodinium sp. CCMP2456]